MSLKSDTRGDSVGIFRLFLGLIVGAIMVGIVWEVGNKILDVARTRGSGQVATESTTYIQQAVDYLPVIFLLISFFGVVAYALYQRQVYG